MYAFFKCVQDIEIQLFAYSVKYLFGRFLLHMIIIVYTTRPGVLLVQASDCKLSSLFNKGIQCNILKGDSCTCFYLTLFFTSLCG